MIKAFDLDLALLKAKFVLLCERMALENYSVRVYGSPMDSFEVGLNGVGVGGAVSVRRDGHAHSDFILSDGEMISFHHLLNNADDVADVLAHGIHIITARS